MKNNKIKIGPVGLIVTYFIVREILGVLLLGIVNMVLGNKNVASTITSLYKEGQDLSVFVTNVSSVIIWIIIIITTIVFWIIVRKFFSFDQLAMEKFLKYTILLLTITYVTLTVHQLEKGYDNIYTHLLTVRVAGDIMRDEYNDDPDNFEGKSFAEGCKTLEDINEAEKDTTNAWIKDAFITPVLPKLSSLLIMIVSLEVFSHVTKERIKSLFSFLTKEKEKTDNQ